MNAEARKLAGMVVGIMLLVLCAFLDWRQLQPEHSVSPTSFPQIRWFWTPIEEYPAGWRPGGANWINGIAVLPRTQGRALVAVGDSAVLKTTDGGVSWSVEPTDAPVRPFNVTFADAQSGWAVFGNGTVLHSADAGLTWKRQSTGTTQALRGVGFANVQSGGAVGDYGTILHTSDSGETWIRQESGTTYFLSGLVFVDAQSGWVAGYGGTVLHTYDGGAH
jgi:photosystem II stability/assembly factor-like uncharacterized protein